MVHKIQVSVLYGIYTHNHQLPILHRSTVIDEVIEGLLLNCHKNTFTVSSKRRMSREPFSDFESLTNPTRFQ